MLSYVVYRIVRPSVCVSVSDGLKTNSLEGSKEGRKALFFLPAHLSVDNMDLNSLVGDVEEEDEDELLEVDDAEDPADSDVMLDDFGAEISAEEVAAMKAAAAAAEEEQQEQIPSRFEGTPAKIDLSDEYLSSDDIQDLCQLVSQDAVGNGLERLVLARCSVGINGCCLLSETLLAM